MKKEKDDVQTAQLAQELSRVYRLELGAGRDVQQAVAAYGQDPHVVYAQPNYLNQLCVVPDDSLYRDQWALTKMQMPAAWDIERGGQEVIVGIVDSGIDYDHRDLADNIWINPGEDLNGDGQADSSDFNGIDDDGNGYVDDIRGWDFTDAPQFAGLGDYRERDNDPYDDLGHGTHVSGIVAAMADNGIGVAGISWHSKLMPLRAAFRMTLGSFLEDDDVSAGIVYAADNGAQVINMSWGDPRLSPLVRDVIASAHTHGKRVGLCGELAGEPLAVPILLGLGLDEFSMNPPAIPLAKQIIRALTLDEAREITLAVLELDSPDEVRALVRERVPAANVG